MGEVALGVQFSFAHGSGHIGFGKAIILSRNEVHSGANAKDIWQAWMGRASEEVGTIETKYLENLENNVSDSLDDFLGGRVSCFQPARGFRAGTDSVLLASAIPARPGERLYELGAGSGVGLVCVAGRVGDVELFGAEIIAENADRANRNIAHNEARGKVENCDALSPSPAIREQQFDHVMMNPPFFDAHAHSPPSSVEKRHAHIAMAPLSDWVRAAKARLRPGGSLTIIHLPEKLGDILGALEGVGNIRILPIISKPGAEAGRIIVQGRSQSAGGLALLSPLALHDADGARSARSEEISREAAGLSELWV